METKPSKMKITRPIETSFLISGPDSNAFDQGD